MLRRFSRGKRRMAQVLALAALVALAYSNSLNNPFHFDDFHVIVDNPAVRGPADIPSFYRDPATFSLRPGNRDYRPVFLTSMALSWWAGNGSPLPFHLVSISVHLACVLLLLFVCLRLFATDTELGERLSCDQREFAAVAASAIFAVHPLATEPVNYISSQSVLLAAMFYLLSFHLFLAANAATPRSRSVRWSLQGGSYLAFFLALVSKPIAITLPGSLLLWEVLFGASGNSSPPRPVLARRVWQRMGKHLPYIGVSLFYLTLRQTLLPHTFGHAARSITSHYLTQTKALVLYYLKYALAPHGLNVDPEFPLSTSPLDSGFLISALVLIGLAIVIYRLRTYRSVVFWALWFPVCLLVTTYLTVLGQLVNEHRVYLSMAGFSALAGLGFAWLSARFPLHISDLSIGPRSGRRLVKLLFAGLLLILGLGTLNRNRVWSSELTLWEDAALHNGTWRAHMNYGLALETAGHSDQAFSEFQKAVGLFPGAYPHINLGLAYLRRGNNAEGLAHLRQAVQLWPDLPEGRLYLAYGLEQNGLTREAKKEFREAIRLRPNYIEGYRLLAEFYQHQGQKENAAAAYRKILELDPAQSWANARIAGLGAPAESASTVNIDRGYDQIAAGDFAAAVRILKNAYPAAPKDPELLFNLAYSLQKLGRRLEAIHFYRELLEVSPGHVRATFNLAYALMESSDEDDLRESARLFRKVTELDPNYSEAIFRLATVYWKLGDSALARRTDRLYLEAGKHPDLRRTAARRLATK